MCETTPETCRGDPFLNEFPETAERVCIKMLGNPSPLYAKAGVSQVWATPFPDCVHLVRKMLTCPNSKVGPGTEKQDSQRVLQDPVSG